MFEVFTALFLLRQVFTSLEIGTKRPFDDIEEAEEEARVLDLLKPVKLTVWKVVIERVTVVKFRMDIGGGMVLAVLKSRYGQIHRRQHCFIKCHWPNALRI